MVAKAPLTTLPGLPVARDHGLRIFFCGIEGREIDRLLCALPGVRGRRAHGRIHRVLAALAAGGAASARSSASPKPENTRVAST